MEISCFPEKKNDLVMIFINKTVSQIQITCTNLNYLGNKNSCLILKTYLSGAIITYSEIFPEFS